MTSGTVVGKRLVEVEKGVRRGVAAGLKMGQEDAVDHLRTYGGMIRHGDRHERGLAAGYAARRGAGYAAAGATGAVTADRRAKKRQIAKGVLRQSVQPRLARKAPAAGTNGRRFVTGDQNSGIIGKAMTTRSPEEVIRLLDKAKRQPKRTWESSKIDSVQQGGRLKGDVGKAFSLGGVQRSFKTGLQGGLGKQTNLTSPVAKPERMAQQVGFLAAKNRKPLTYGAAGTAAAGTGYALSKVYVEENGREWRDDDGNRGKGSYGIPGHAKRVKRFTIGEPVRKRHGDPEDARYARLGAASAASGIGAAGLAYQAGKGPIKLNRALAKDKNLQGSLRNKANQPGTSKPVKGLLEALGSGKPGVMLTRRQALLGLGSIGAGTASYKTARAASDRRWN